MPVKDTLRMCADYLTVAQREKMEEQQAQTFHSLILLGKLRMAVRWITDWEKGGVLQAGDRCTKTGHQVMEVLRSKHLEARTPTAASLETYPDQPPELTPVDITYETVMAVVGQLSSGARPGGTESVSLQHWLLRFGAASAELRLIVRDFTEWMANGRPPSAAYRSLMSGRLTSLDKQPGIRPVGVGETWRRLMEKWLLQVTGPEVKAACSTSQLDVGVEAEIEGAIHSMRVIWEEHSLKGDWGFLLIEARNSFNEENRTDMLCSIQNELPSGT